MNMERAKEALEKTQANASASMDGDLDAEAEAELREAASEKERGGVVTFLHADSLRIRATQARRHSPTPPPLRPP